MKFTKIENDGIYKHVICMDNEYYYLENQEDDLQFFNALSAKQQFLIDGASFKHSKTAQLPKDSQDITELYLVNTGDNDDYTCFLYSLVIWENGKPKDHIVIQELPGNNAIPLHHVFDGVSGKAIKLTEIQKDQHFVFSGSKRLKNVTEIEVLKDGQAKVKFQGLKELQEWRGQGCPASATPILEEIICQEFEAKKQTINVKKDVAPKATTVPVNAQAKSEKATPAPVKEQGKPKQHNNNGVTENNAKRVGAAVTDIIFGTSMAYVAYQTALSYDMAFEVAVGVGGVTGVGVAVAGWFLISYLLLDKSANNNLKK